MAFFAPYKPTVRQEGFDPSDLYHQFLPDSFRKFPSASPNDSAINFDDELASLIAHPPPSNERSTHEENAYQHTRNIFDISAPTPSAQQQPIPLPSSASSTASAFSTHFGSAPPANTNVHDFGTPHFSSLRYEQHPDAPPSSYHTPSPSHQQHSRSRSRSRPPSTGSVGPAAAAGVGGGGVGPARTTRSRRNNSVSSTSPPPPHGRPQAIVIPRSASNSNNGAMSPLASGFMPGSHPASDYSLSESHSHTHHPTHAHHHHSHSQPGFHPHHHPHYTAPPFSSSIPNGNGPANGNGTPGNNSADPPPSMHLPPVSALHSHSLPKTANGSMHRHFSSASGYCGLNGLPALNGLGALNGGSTGTTTTTAGGGGGGPVSPVSPSTPGGGGTSTLASLQATNGGGALTAHEKQAAIANEKRRRRRESHNAVERRRRDNINEKISELATLIPECMLEAIVNGQANNHGNGGGVSPLDDGLLPSPLEVFGPGASANGGGGSPREGSTKKEDGSDTGAEGVANGVNGAGGANGVVKANKGMILRKSVEYIRYLQQLVTAQGARNRELEAELKVYRAAAGIIDGGDRREEAVASSVSPSRTSGSGGSSVDGGELMLHDEGQQQQRLSHLHSHSLGSHGHRHGHGHVRGTSANGFGSFGGMFGLPSMPEGGESSEDVGGVGDDMDDGMEGVEEDDIHRGEEEDEKRERGRTRVKSLVGLPHHINIHTAKMVKEEQEVVEMDT